MAESFLERWENVIKGKAPVSPLADATNALETAGHKVTPAQGVPGLYDVAGIGRDLTIGQVVDVASRLTK